MDQLILKESIKHKLAWPTREPKEAEPYEGARITEPKIGLHKSVQNYDVKQMYPSIIINEGISPDKDHIIVPNVLKELKKLRAVYKKKYQETNSKEDYITQYSYKVLANLVYGGYGNGYCRFYDLSLIHI